MSPAPRSLYLYIGLVVVLALAGVSQAIELTKSPDTPGHIVMANVITEQVAEHVRNEMKELQQKFDAAISTVQETCGMNQREADAPDVPPRPPPHTQELTTKIQGIESTLQTAIQKMDALEGKLHEKTDSLASSADFVSFKNEIKLLLNQSIYRVYSELGNVVKVDEVREVVREQVEEVKEVVRGVEEVCERGDSEVVQVVEGMMGQVNEHVEDMKVDLVHVKVEVERCGKNTTEGLREVEKEVEEVEGKMREMRETVEEKLQGIGEKVEEIYVSTQLMTATPPPPPPQEEEVVDDEVKGQEEVEGQEEENQTLPVYPCVDSAFIGVLDRQGICNVAARLHKCHLPPVAYHCCHTCTSRGLLPAMGPWRHAQIPRIVSPVEVGRFFYLSKGGIH